MAEAGTVIGCHTVNDLNRQIEQAYESNKLVVVDFTAPWCGPCRMMAPLFAELAKKYPHVVFLRVDVSELKRVAMECAIESLPTFLFVKEGTVVDKVVGARKEELPMKVLFHMPK